MIERKHNIFKRQVNELVDGIIAMRQSSEPFFGVQTVFAPLIDRLAVKRGYVKEDIMNPSPENITYIIKAISEPLDKK